MSKSNLCGKQVKIARVSLDMQQVELAAALSVECGIEINQSVVSAIERGTRKVSDVELVALSCVLQKSIAWLIYGEEKM